MAFGPQISGGTPSRTFFGGTSNFGAPIAPVAVDSEGVVLGRMQQETADKNRDAGLMAGAADRNALTQRSDADRAANFSLGMAPINLKRDIFNQVSPLLTGLMGGGNNERVGGTGTPAPDITRGPVWSGQQVNEQVNAGLASNAANADTQNRQNATGLAAQGFGSRSPLLAALNSSVGMQRAAADADFARDTRFDTAKANAEQVTTTDQLAVDRWDRGERNDIARRQAAFNQQSQLAAVLAGLV